MENVRAVERALELLDCFSSQRKQMGLSELSRLLDLPKATVLRLARTLESKGYLIQDSENQNYRLGPKVVSLSKEFLSDLDFRLIAIPFMKELRDQIQETVTLYVINGNKRLCVHRVESHHSLRQAVNIGDLLPLNKGSSGKLLVAFLGLESVVDGVPLEELQEIRDNGYSVSFEEREEGLSSVSAPIRNHNGEVIAALSVSGLATRFAAEKIGQFITKLLRAAEQISYRLGYLE
ncbi:IclR family transcriptional regulator [Alicyclobacillus tolerans]|uniref:IclR family transcriptional regulator n=1 Tax=Alicyclobacillus tolerans TaxID=90970 RepID=UPI001F3F155B|nr:IclR family transcriptional regulator [Alicyclobacillus tolerans]MCF8567831.1 IclR family transcriptional regulator [Alicyclobacillus tolerans]